MSTIGVGASAIYHKWSNGTRDKFQVTGGDMEKYEQSGLAKFPGDESGVREVTQNGVTISVAQTIIDNYYAYVSFRIEGFDIKAGGTPDLRHIIALWMEKRLAISAAFMSRMFLMQQDSR